jgi:hypothetical protein
MVKYVVIVIGFVVAGLRPAAADSPRLDQARRAVEEVRYDEARSLLVQALRDGGNRPAAMIEIYELSATTAIVLGQKDLAEQYYRRLLALKPDATIADDVAPKLREPFVAAQAYMAANGRLQARLHRAPDGRIDAVVTADPLGMAVGATLVVGGIAGPPTPLADRRASMTPTGGFEAVVILDENGNQLVSIPASAATDAPPPPPVVRPVPPPRDRPSSRSVPIYRRTLFWAIPTVVAAGIGIGFALDASSANSTLQEILDNSEDHTLEDAEHVRRRRDSSAQTANISFAVAGAFAVVTTIVFLTRPSSRDAKVIVAPTAGDGAVGLSVFGEL